MGAGVLVNGPLTAGGTLAVPSSAVLKGKVSTNTPIPALEPALATVTFSVEPAVDVPANSTRNLAPGRYGETRVEAGGTLSLSAGTYYVTSLTVPAGAKLHLDETQGAVVVFVKSRFDFAGAEDQVGSDGHVLIAAFGCEPTVLWAPFMPPFAQNAWLSLIAPNQTFVGRFFADFIEVNAETTVDGLGLTLPNGPSPVAGGVPTQPPKPLPVPPPSLAAGCYVNTPNGWHGVPCATDASSTTISRIPMHSLRNRRRDSIAGIWSGRGNDPRGDVRANAFLASTAGIPGCTGSGSPLANEWSVQSNTNQWTIASGSNAGDNAGTQFVIQSNGSTNAICLWNVDVTLGYPKGYSKTCVVPTPPQRSGGLQAFDMGNIAAYTNSDGTLSMVAELSWVPSGQPNQYLLNKVPDTFGLNGHWSQVSGGLIGFGACSQAQFTNAEVVTQVAASTCNGDTTAASPTCAPPTLQPNASAFVGPNGTVETNNLTAIGGTPAVSYPNSDLAVTSVTATTSGGCLGPSHAYVKDSVNDFGATPSTLGDAVFWESEDIFLVPHGAPVSLTAVSTETAIMPGGHFRSMCGYRTISAVPTLTT